MTRLFHPYGIKNGKRKRLTHCTVKYKGIDYQIFMCFFTILLAELLFV